MKLFGNSHIAVLIITFLLPFLFYYQKKKIPKNNFAEWFLAFSIIVSELLYLTTKIYANKFDLRYHLPLQLCDLAAIMVVLYIFYKKNIFFELSYFWGLSGTFQALLTPDLKVDFPHLDFFIFFMMHSGIIIGVLYFSLIGEGKLSQNSYRKAFFISQIYIAVMVPFNYFTQSNYGYLMEKPFSGSLLDYLGPWPWYLLSFEVLGLIMFFLLQSIFLSLKGTQKSSDK